MSLPGPVVVIGGVNVDVVAEPSGPPVPAVSNPGRVRIGPGGAGRNVAENLARLGLSVRLIAAADAHPLTTVSLAEAARAGVDTSGVIRIHGRGNYYVAVEHAGALLWAVSDMSAAEALAPSDLDERAWLLKDAGAVVVDANLQPATIVRAADLAGGTRLCLLAVSAAKAERLRPVLPRASLIACGVPEAAALTGLEIRSRGDAARAARRLRPEGGTVLITMGPQGLGWFGAEEVWVDAPPVAVRDPTGAGDAAAAAAVYALLTGMEAKAGAGLAMAAAAMTLEVEGATHPGLSLEALRGRR
ncbi:MAG: PfkB family carbohydrate kinase [Armatimonadota bacterium]|nr:PfkB family carbohydrate kinase [Armatimonadota bacterium]MDR7450243.1 PfkB family carbohydrate kinase [Armatimonadota bacterium]MDR7468477.1 PfkB family carbohydrate kinase [Armatimonadota bacterium]MDR7500133.1 PfkB family carbohydrate kinase [Armatimonadota bacterium]MDR7552279.1 PfkB family carbohydrate kinase [Armatimonadota bacterium]